MSVGFAAFSLITYVVLDGFDLGVGTLLFLERDKALRNHMIDSITPTWDGNETWLVMAAITLLACFPIAYGILLPALYLPAVVMVLSLGLRGVSFEYRKQSPKSEEIWGRVFAVGSVLAAFMQGVMLGSLLDGIRTEDLRFSGSVLDIFRPLPLLSGVTLVIGYTVLGGGWLHLKGNNSIQHFASRALRLGSVGFASLFCLACLYSANTKPGVAVAWSVQPLVLSVMASLFVILSGCIFITAGKPRPLLPFMLSISQFIVGMIGIAVILYPNIVPFRVSLWEAAAPKTTQIFFLIGAGLVAPVVITYSAFAYWVFRGKTPAKGWEL